MPSMTRTSPLRRSLGKTLTVLAGATLLFGLAACAPTPAPDELKTDGDYETSMLDWRQNMDDCMLDAGFDLVAMSENDGSSASIDMSQIDMVAFDKAYAGCSDTVGEAPIDAGASPKSRRSRSPSACARPATTTQTPSRARA